MKDELRTDGDPIAWRFRVLPEPAVECLSTCIPKFERKNKSYPCSSSVVSKMYPRGGERSGSKLTMVLLLCNYTLHWPLTFSC